VKRFSAKEEHRRVVAAITEPKDIQSSLIGLENHLNYFHANGGGVPPMLAKGLSAFLNSTLLDMYFRQFSGHTQVNATDLRNLHYPAREQLLALGRAIPAELLTQSTLDGIVEKHLFPASISGTLNPTHLMKRIEEAAAVLQNLGFPRPQINERSALTLLALLDLKPETPWSEASNPPCGITPMMDFFAEHYQKQYKPNTRETVRRQTVHQFLDAGLIIANPDRLDRPINSPKTVYRVTDPALNLLRTYGSEAWEAALDLYLTSVETLKQTYAQERAMARIPIDVPPINESSR
jgi:adenine-specific DNA-methyltransferase